MCLAPVYANRREGLVFRGVVERVVGGGADGERGTIYVRPTGAIDVGLSGDAVLEIPVADAEIVRIRDLTNVHCETAKGVRPLYLQAGRGRLADIDVARLVAPNLRQILQT